MNNNLNMTQLKIWQQNTQKSSPALLTTLYTISEDTDIICIQEPSLNFLGFTTATLGWHPIYPTGTTHGENNEPRTCSIIMVNSRLSTNTWTQIDIPLSDITAVQIKGPRGTINIYNNYEDNASITALQRHLNRCEEDGQRTAPGTTHADIWLGYFNRHHPMWEDTNNERLFTRAKLEKAESLLYILAEHDMQMILSKDLPTIINSQQNYTGPDNVFSSPEIEDWVIEYRPIKEEKPPTADHFPIVTTLEFPTKTTPQEHKRNYRKTNWTAFLEELNIQLLQIPAPIQLQSKEDLEQALDNLEQAIQNTAEKCVPQKKPTPYSKHWWTKELMQARNSVRKLTGTAAKQKTHPHHPVHKELHQTRNKYTDLLKKTKDNYWNNWISSVNSINLWNAH